MPNTITTYFTFQPDTAARASDVNTNFSNYRGDLIPINANTASASDLSHQLGTSEHRWSTVYIQTLNLSNATTSGLEIVPNEHYEVQFPFSTITVKTIDFKVDDTVTAQLDRGGFYVRRFGGTVGQENISTSTAVTLTGVGVPLTVTAYGHGVLVTLRSEGYLICRKNTLTVGTITSYAKLTLRYNDGNNDAALGSLYAGLGQTNETLTATIVPCNGVFYFPQGPDTVYFYLTLEASPGNGLITASLDGAGAGLNAFPMGKDASIFPY